ncbi:MAG: hypothetical protein WAN79_01975 [Opitutaceae bacterium]
MNPANFVVHKKQREHMFVILDLLREGVCEAGEAPVTHADREVVALNVASGNVGVFRLAAHNGLASTHALRRGVASLGLGA